MTISPEILTDSGYKLYTGSFDFEPPFKLGLWQKKFADERGIKYFLNIKQTKGFYDTDTHVSMNWWPHIQFEILVKDRPQAVNIEFVQWLNDSGKYSKLTITDIEEYANNIWLSLNGLYYETF